MGDGEKDNEQINEQDNVTVSSTQKMRQGDGVRRGWWGMEETT